MADEFAIIAAAATVLAVVGIWRLRLRWNREQADPPSRSEVPKGTLLLNLATRFIDLPSDRIEGELEQSLQPLLAELGLDRVKLFEFSPNGAVFDLVAGGVAEGVPLGSKSVSPLSLGIHRDSIWDRRPLLVSDLSQLPARESGLATLLAPDSVRSFAAFPLWAGEELLGAIAFTSVSRNVDWSGALLQDLELISAVFTHVMARRRLAGREETLQRGLKEVFQQAPICVAEVSPDGRFMTVNRAWCELTRLDVQDLATRTWQEVTHKADVDRERELVDSLLTGVRERYRMEKRFIRRDGTTVWADVSTAVLNDAKGEPRCLIMVAQDISNSKAAETMIIESEARLRLALQSGRMFAFEVLWETGILSRSLDGAAILGLPHGQASETWQRHLSRIHPEDRSRLENAISGLSSQRRSYQVTFRISRPDGRIVWLEESGRGEFGPDGRLTRITGVCADVTIRKEEEAARRDWADRLVHYQEQDRARIARELHDDIGQRIALLALRLDGLRMGIDGKQRALKSSLDDAWREVHELGLDLNRVSHELHTMKLGVLGLPAALRSLCHDFSTQNSVGTTFVGPPDGTSFGERTDLTVYRIAQEALRNVAKHSGARSAQLTLETDGTTLRFQVKDDGVGFEGPGGVRKPGLGLLSMQERLTIVGGTMAVESSPGGGTILTIQVPLP